MRTLIRATAACAIVVAAAHTVINDVSVAVFNRLTWTSRDFAWMAPIAYAVVFGAIALAAAPFRRARLTLIGAVAAWSLLLLVPGVHPLALLVMALGAGRAMAPLWERLTVWRLQTIGAVGLVVSLGSTAWAYRSTGPWGRRAAAAEAPNVLLLILDTVGAKQMSLYGYGRPTTPHIDTLANSNAVVFEHAFATSSWSLPSHAGVLSGLFPNQTGGSYVAPLHTNIRTVAHAFRANGYATGGFTANVGFAGYQTNLMRGFEYVRDYPRSLTQIALTPTLSHVDALRIARENWRGGYMRGVVKAFRPRNLRLVGVRAAPFRPAVDVIQEFNEWRSRITRPFFAFVNLMEAHAPYMPPEPHRSRFGTSERDRYDGAIAYLDSVVVQLFASLPPNTIVVVTADHGEQWGEKGFAGHGNTLYLPALRVPLIIRAPELAPHRVETPVSLRDVPATLMDLAGLDESFPGGSLRDPHPGAIYAEATQGTNVGPENQTYDGPIRTVVDSAFHYILLPSGAEELYDWQHDPDELHNLVVERADVLPRYRALLKAR